jgi:hypothetical protein
VPEQTVFPLEPHARKALEQLPVGQSFVLMSLIRFRRDLPDGQADHSLLEYRRALKQLTIDIGAKTLKASRVLHTFAGRQEHWDAVLVTWMPNLAAFQKSHQDPRIAMAMRHRDEGFEDMLSVLVRPYAIGGQHGG